MAAIDQSDAPPSPEPASAPPARTPRVTTPTPTAATATATTIITTTTTTCAAATTPTGPLVRPAAAPDGPARLTAERTPYSGSIGQSRGQGRACS